MSLESKDVRVIDGDSIVVNNINIRLIGIDAPEIKQQCGGGVNCGILAREKLRDLIGVGVVRCSNRGLDRYRRVLSYCYVGDMNLNLAMVRFGYAYAYFGDNFLFKGFELVSRLGKMGLWRVNFDNPKDWRKARKRSKW